MAKTYALKRSTSQVSAIDTVSNLVSPIGAALVGVSTISAGTPTGAQNTLVTFLGDPYALVATTTGTIEIRKYDDLTNTWSVSGSAFNPTVVVLTLAGIVGVISPGDSVTAGGASGTVSAVAGNIITVAVATGMFTAPSALVATPVIPGPGATATISIAVQGAQTPTCLQIVNDSLIAVWNETSGIYSKMSAATTKDGITWTVRQNSSPSASLANSVGGSSCVWSGALFFSTAKGIGNFLPPTLLAPNGQMGIIDSGNEPLVPNPLTDPVTPQGCLAYWNGTLYFVKPATLTSLPKFFSLKQGWTFGDPTPQWDIVSGVVGLQSVGFISVDPDKGNYCLFVNKVGNLCLLYSGSLGTKLISATVASFPTFTDLTTDKLPIELSSSVDLGVTIYIDTRHRLNEQQTLFFRDTTLSGNLVMICGWDGINPVKIQETIPSSDYVLTSDRAGHLRTYTALQPGAFIADAFVSQTAAERTYFIGSPISGVFTLGEAFYTYIILNAVNISGVISIGDTVTAGAGSGTVMDISGNVVTVQLNSGAFPTLGPASQVLFTLGGLNQARNLALTPPTTVPIAPGTFSIQVTTVANGIQYIRDDGLGNLINPLALAAPGTINYTTGALTGTTLSLLALTSLTATYEKAFTLNDTTSFATALITAQIPQAAGTVEVLSGDIIGLSVTSGDILSGLTVKAPLSGATAVVSNTPVRASVFAGRAALIYELRDKYDRNMDIVGEYSIVGDTWLPMTQGGGDSGYKGLASSTSGTLHVFYWDAFSDLVGNYTNLWLRLVPRVSIASNQTPPNAFVAVTQESYLKAPTVRGASELILTVNSGHSIVAGETVTGAGSGATGFVQTVDLTHVVVTSVNGVFDPLGEVLNGSIVGHTATYTTSVSNVISNILVPADETTDLEEFNETLASLTNPVGTRVRSQYVFQGRLSSNQTRVRFIKLTLRGSAVGALAKISIYVSGQGSINQYVSTRSYWNFQSLPLADQELIIEDVDLLNQPSALGKKFSVVVESDLGPGQSMVVSTPFVRCE